MWTEEQFVIFLSYCNKLEWCVKWKLPVRFTEKKDSIALVQGGRDAQFQAQGDSQESLPHPAGAQRFSNKHSRKTEVRSEVF